MDMEKEIIENKGKTRLNDARFQALVNILTKEGILTKEEVDEEMDELLREEKKNES